MANRENHVIEQEITQTHQYVKRKCVKGLVQTEVVRFDVLNLSIYHLQMNSDREKTEKMHQVNVSQQKT